MKKKKKAKALKTLAASGNMLDRYVAEINAYPLLSRVDELDMALHYQETMDQKAEAVLIQSNLRFVVKVAHQYKGYGFSLLDLIQEGNAGLVTAVRKFDPQKGFRLISFAVWWIKAYIQSYLIKNWSLVRVGTTANQRSLFYKLRGAQRELSKNGILMPSELAQAVAERLNMPLEDVVDMDQRMNQRDTSLDVTIDDESTLTFVDRQVHPGLAPDETAEEKQMDSRLKLQVRMAMATLDDRERQIIRLRYLEEDGETLAALGDRMGLSRERIRQIERRAMDKVRNALRAYQRRDADTEAA